MHTLSPALRQGYTIDFINRSFRDVADKDYIAARILHKAGLDIQFLWMAHQATEKYLKAILLYNGSDTRDIKHDLVKAYRRVRAIKDIPFDFPRIIDEFVSYLNEEGPNRYFEYPTFHHGQEVFLLDASVWHIRRYCYFIRGTVRKPDGKEIDLLPLEIRRINSDVPSRAHRLRILGGLLEKVLDDRGSYLRRELVWKNFYYGSYAKRVIRNVRLIAGSANPTHYLHPDIFEDLDKLVQFSKPVRDYFHRAKASVDATDKERA